MSEIDLSEKLKQLEAEVDDEIRVQNETRQKIWKDRNPYSAEIRDLGKCRRRSLKWAGR